jgi:hypothetical protein
MMSHQGSNKGIAEVVPLFGADPALVLALPRVELRWYARSFTAEDATTKTVRAW